MAVESWGDIYALPEDCIATALSLTSPKDACRLSLVASTFRSASQSDAVWSRFLPSDYRSIISRADDGDSLLSKFHSKKDLYLHLCDHPILIDEGHKSFSLEKLTGKKCYMLAAKDLTIVWGDTPQYWKWVKLPESRFSEVAELLRVCWFEVRGKINVHMLSSATNYAVYLVFIRKPTTTYGFAPHTAEASVGMSGCGCEKQSVYLDPGGELRLRSQIIPSRVSVGLLYRRLVDAPRQQENIPGDQNRGYPKQRNDGWMEVELGEWFVNGGEDGDFEVGLVQNNSDWKSGLVIQGIEIRPKESK
ncbi:hypothetical protein ACS0TY_002145 [Phlomoides rotata]